MSVIKNNRPGSGIAAHTIWNRPFITIFLAGILTALSSHMTIPLISKYALSLGTSLSMAGTVASLMSIAALVCRPFSGAFADSFNRKHLTVAATLLAAVTVGVNAFTQNLALVMVIRVVHGVAFSVMTVANMALASSLIPREKMGESMGYLSLGAILSAAIGPGLGMHLSENFGFSVCFAASTVFMIAGALATLTVQYRPPEKTESKKPVLRWENLYAKELTIYMLILALFSYGNGLASTFLTLIGDERGIANIALFFTSYSLTVVLIRPLTGILLDKKGLSVILYPSFLIYGIGMALVGAASSLWVMVLAGALRALGQGSGAPAIQAYSIKLSGRDRAGVASSTCYIGMDIGNSIAPILGGICAGSIGYAPTFYSYAVVMVVGGLLLYTLQCKIEKKRKS